ncbi:MAG: glycosyltransferase [Bdellovibrionales bacterium]|nr:glycosyltransferase [Bdellovibrionales bacterium]
MSDDFKRYVSSPSVLVSAVIPVYNKAAYLSEAIKSLLDQTYKNLEILVVNDGSTDNSANLVKDLIRENPSRKIRLLDKVNGGVSDARNYGIREAQSRVILILDADDRIDSSFVQKGLDVFRSHEINLFCSNVQVFGAKSLEWNPQEFDQYRIRYDNCISQCSMFDRELWVRANGYKVAFSFVEDWDFWIGVSRCGARVFKSPERLVFYRSTLDGLHNSFIEEHRDECMAMLITANEDLYPVEEILSAHDTISNMPTNLVAKIGEMNSKHPTDGLLKLWLGCIAFGKEEIEKAMQFFTESSILFGHKNWQPLFGIVKAFEASGWEHQTIEPLKKMMILRPDTTRFVKERIDRLVKKYEINVSSERL